MRPRNYGSPCIAKEGYVQIASETGYTIRMTSIEMSLADSGERGGTCQPSSRRSVSDAYGSKLDYSVILGFHNWSVMDTATNCAL